MIAAKLDRITRARYQIDGPIQKQIQGVIDNWLLVVPDRNPAILEMFASRDSRSQFLAWSGWWQPWSGEFAGKYVTASTQIIRLTQNSALSATIVAFVERLLSLQDEDGYLGPFPYAGRFAQGTWDAWGHYHVMTGLLLWYEQTGDQKVLSCVQRIGDMLCRRFLGEGKHVADMGSADQNQAIIHSLCSLYEMTGTKRYMDLAQQIIGEFELPGAGDYLRTALAGQEFYATPKPRWESLHAIMGLAELFLITGNEDFRGAFEHVWWSIAKLDRHNNGGFSSREQAVGNPYDGSPIETCCTIAWLAASVEMLRLTGSSLIADDIELSTLNSIVGLHARDGAWCTYNTPMNGRRVPSTHGITFQRLPGIDPLNCCSVNAARGFGLISDWGVMRHYDAANGSQAIVLNWYGPSTIRAAVENITVSLRQETDYPRGGRIELYVDPPHAAQFTLMLRIPGWSAKTSIEVNGVPEPTQAGSYCVLDRQWKPGDRVTINLDMRIRAWSGELECAGMVSLYRGPILLVSEQKGWSEEQRPAVWEYFEGFDSRNRNASSTKIGESFEYAFAGESIKWFGFYSDDAGISVVLIDGIVVARVDQYGSEREEVFSWGREGLEPGKHVIRIESTGEKMPKSKGTFVNVTGFGPANAEHPYSLTGLPPLDLRSAHAELVDAQGQFSGATVAVEITDAIGQTVRLRDFGTAGENGVHYSSWLWAKNVLLTPFTPANPLRCYFLTEASSDRRSESDARIKR